MTWTYDPSEATSRDKVRSLIGDTNTKAQLLADETLDAILADTDDVQIVAQEAIRRILAKIARDTDRSAAGITNTRSQVTQHYRDMLTRLERQTSLDASMTAGGTSKAERTLLESDTDFIRPPDRVGVEPCDPLLGDS